VYNLKLNHVRPTREKKIAPMVRARESRIQKANQLNPNSKSDYSIDVKVDREAEIQTRHQYVSLCTDKLAMSLKNQNRSI